MKLYQLDPKTWPLEPTCIVPTGLCPTFSFNIVLPGMASCDGNQNYPSRGNDCPQAELWWPRPTTQTSLSSTLNSHLCRWTMEWPDSYLYLIVMLKSLPKEELKPHLLNTQCIQKHVSSRCRSNLLPTSTYRQWQGSLSEYSSLP